MTPLLPVVNDFPTCIHNVARLNSCRARSNVLLIHDSHTVGPAGGGRVEQHARLHVNGAIAGCRELHFDHWAARSRAFGFFGMRSTRGRLVQSLAGLFRLASFFLGVILQ
jgi:hypothetical protein